jgi:uncharacterized membrane protein YphA (DoxX/SURF4 family)
MNTLLWIAQGFLCLIFLYSGYNKATKTEEELIKAGQTGVEGIPKWLIRFIGIMELLGTCGIFLPWLLNVIPILTPITAMCFSIIMVLAGIIHLRRKEFFTALGNFTILAAAVFVALGRLHLI